jgi:hypothetical protein
MAFGLLPTTELVIDDRRVSSSRNPTQAEVGQWLAASCEANQCKRTAALSSALRAVVRTSAAEGSSIPVARDRRVMAESGSS